jgi:hypothetical protein
MVDLRTFGVLPVSVNFSLSKSLYVIMVRTAVLYDE